MIVKQARTEAVRLGNAISRARGFIGPEPYAYVYMEFSNTGKLAVVATDGQRLVATNVPLSMGMEEGERVVLHEVDVQQVNSFLQNKGGREVTVIAGEDFVGFSFGPQAKLMVERAVNVAVLPWREKIVGRHQPGAQVSFDPEVLRAAIAPFTSQRMIFHLPEGDGQAAHLYHPDSDAEVWIMPTASSVAGVMNQVPAEGGEPPTAPTE